jgi:hypothetical protein
MAEGGGCGLILRLHAKDLLQDALGDSYSALAEVMGGNKAETNRFVSRVSRDTNQCGGFFNG